MKFAIVGETADTLPIALSLDGAEQHSVTHVAMVPSDSRVMANLPGARLVAEWEDLLADDTVEAVVISGHEDQVLPPARQIAGTGRPLLVVPSVGLTAAFAYELTLVRDENLVPLYPILLHRLDPAAVRLRGLLDESAIGDLIQIRIERTITTTDNLLTQDRDVEPWLQPDADMLRWMGGAFTQVTAIYQGTSDGGFVNATVNLAGDNATDSSWTLATGPTEAWKLTASGSAGQLVLERNAGVSRLTKNGESVSLADGSTESHEATWLAALPKATSAFIQANARNDQASVWTDFTRSHEIVDAHRRSIRRRRTIDMHFETLSERSQFKTQMAAMGCGILTYTLFGLVAYLGFAGALEPAEEMIAGDAASEAEWSRYRLICNIAFAVWIGPLTLFLAAQLLLGITKPPAKPDDAPLDAMPTNPETLQ